MSTYTFDRHELNLLAAACREIVVGHLPEGSCVATARVLVDVGSQFGWNIRPFCAGVMYRNDQHSVGTPYTGQPDPVAGTVGGHILVLAKRGGRGWLVDPSADMFSRPGKGMHIGGPLAAPVRDGLFELFRSPQGATFNVPGHGFKVTWRMADNQMAWRDSADWTVPDRKAELFEQMRAEARAMYTVMAERYATPDSLASA